MYKISHDQFLLKVEYGLNRTERVGVVSRLETITGIC